MLSVIFGLYVVFEYLNFLLSKIKVQNKNMIFESFYVLEYNCTDPRIPFIFQKYLDFTPVTFPKLRRP